jgi:hypothetical protein
MATETPTDPLIERLADPFISTIAMLRIEPAPIEHIVDIGHHFAIECQNLRLNDVNAVARRKGEPLQRAEKRNSRAIAFVVRRPSNLVIASSRGRRKMRKERGSGSGLFSGPVQM